MGVTARQLLLRRHLGLRLVGGAPNADRSITWAHPIELSDPTPYLSGGELVMTTGINVGSTEPAQFDYVARLDRAGISALALDTGATFDDIPPGMVIACDELGMPLLRVPASTPFIAITRAVIDGLTADQLRAVERVAKQQELMARETVTEGAAGVVNALARYLAATAVMITPEGRTLAVAGPDQERAVELGVMHAERALWGRRTTSRAYADDDGYLTSQLVRAAGAPAGYLSVWSAAPLTSLDRLLVSHAVSLISVEIEKPARVLDSERRLKAAIGAALMDIPERVDRELLQSFGFTPDDPTCVVVVLGAGAQQGGAPAARALGQRVAHLAFASHDDYVLILAGDHRGIVEDVVSELSARAGRQLQSGLSTGPISRARELVEQARAAARTDRGRVIAFSEIGVFASILGSRTEDELRLIAAPIAALKADLRAPDVLVETLRGYLGSNGKMESTAALLGIHRHTLRNRLRSISARTGIDLDSADARAQLLLALRAQDLLGDDT